MNYNYHTHTKRCRHAKGEAEDYVKRAVDNGIKYMGFSDHMPFIFPDGFESRFRVPVAEVNDYFSEINSLKEKYKSQIDIKIGFEMEYYPEHFETMFKNAVEYGAEYLILGVHFINTEHPSGVPSSAMTDDSERLKDYAVCVTEAIKRGVFSYVAHPDIIKFTGDAETYKEEMKRICDASKQFNIPLEINFLGIREGRNYPCEIFWEVAGEMQSPVTFGFDSHSPGSAFDGESLLKANELVKKYNLNYIGKPELILIQNKR